MTISNFRWVWILQIDKEFLNHIYSESTEYVSFQRWLSNLSNGQYCFLLNLFSLVIFHNIWTSCKHQSAPILLMPEQRQNYSNNIICFKYEIPTLILKCIFSKKYLLWYEDIWVNVSIVCRIFIYRMKSSKSGNYQKVLREHICILYWLTFNMRTCCSKAHITKNYIRYCHGGKSSIWIRNPPLGDHIFYTFLRCSLPKSGMPVRELLCFLPSRKLDYCKATRSKAAYAATEVGCVW